ncbi:MAG: hypothetical protein DRO92_03255 [Candidatus Altiarchaeales archaeon]|nr:MAG: hypothetical protein DRO92_03255 [Candidatus Altiarchaeales archaeon]
MEFKVKVSERDIFKKFISTQLREMNSSLAVQKTLKELLSMDEPFSITRSGDRHLFDKKHLKMLSEIIPYYEHEHIRLPVYLYVDPNISDQYYVKGILESKIIRVLGEMGEGYRIKDEILYIPKVIGRMMRIRYPSIVQFFWLP